MTVSLPDERMSDVDAVVWAIERDPRLRTTIAALARLDGVVDRVELRHRVERAARRIPRLRQRVVTDPLGLAPPRWAVDPEFRLAFHLRHADLGGSGTEQALLELVRDLVAQPFDKARPLWEITLIEGLEAGGTAVLLKSHHAVSDGVGGVELILELFDLQPEAPAGSRELPPAPQPAPQVRTISHSAREEAQLMLRSAAERLEQLGRTSTDDVVASARRLGQTLGSAGRLFRPTPQPISPLMTGRSAGLELRSLSVELEALRAAGARVDGTINDAFVAAVAIGVADHHRSHGVRLERLRVSIPINTRSEGAGVGNHWTPGRIDVTTTDLDPDAMMRQVRTGVGRVRQEPGHALFDHAAGVLRRLPPVAVAAAFTAVAGGIDVAASNVPGTPIPFHLCGQEVRALTPFGPLSGTAANITLLSHGTMAHLGIATDPVAVADAGSFARHLDAALAAVVKGS